jgi:hypothetical protein
MCLYPLKGARERKRKMLQAGGAAQVVSTCHGRQHKAMSSNPSTAKKKKNFFFHPCLGSEYKPVSI